MGGQFEQLQRQAQQEELTRTTDIQTEIGATERAAGADLGEEAGGIGLRDIAQGAGKALGWAADILGPAAAVSEHSKRLKVLRRT